MEEKKFSGQLTEHLATTSNINEAEELIKQGWKLIATDSIPIQTNLGGLAITTLFVLKRELVIQ